MGDYEVLRTVWAYDLSDPDTGDDWELRHRCRGFWKGEADRVKDGQWIAGTDSDHAGAVWKMYVGSEHVNTVKVDEIPPPESESTDNIRLSIYTADESVKLAAVTQKPSWTSALQGTTGLTDPNPLYVYVGEKVVATLGKEAMVNTDGFNWPNWKLIADGTNTLKGAGISPLVPVLIAGKLSFGSVFRGDDNSDSCNTAVKYTFIGSVVFGVLLLCAGCCALCATCSGGKLAVEGKLAFVFEL